MKGDQGIQGEKGDKGDQGEQGIQGEKGDQGEAGKDGYTPEKGKDYWTEEDKQEISDELTSPTEYTNWLPKATTSDGVTIYNGVGYKENTRWSSSGYNETYAAGVYLSGFIKITPGDIIRVKNIVMPYTDSGDANCIVHFYTNINENQVGTHNCINLKTYSGALFDINNNLIQFTVQPTSQHYYIRIQAASMSSKSILTINEEIVLSDEAKFDEINDSLSDLDNRLDNLENQQGQDSILPEYWLTHLEERIDDIREAMELAGRNKSTFLFYSDAHWDNGGKMSPQLLNYLTQYTAINKTIFGGDIVSTEPTVETLSDRAIMEYLWDWRSQIRDLNHYSVLGNHDDGNGNTATGGPTNSIFTMDYVYSFLFAPEESNDIYRGGDSYYYLDDKSEKTRYLFLDTTYESMANLSTEQADFIKEALKGTQADWHIIVISHAWYNADYDAYYNLGIKPIPISGLTTPGSQILAILDSYNAREGEFSDAKAKVEFCIGGHVHIDYVGKSTGGIPVILCETASLNTRGTISGKVGTITETAVSGIIANYKTNVLTVVRVGRGESFEVDLLTGTKIENSNEDDDNTSEPSYTNVLETVGWTENVRLSGSNGSEKENPGSYTTGFIKAKSGDVIYLKNVNMPDSDENYASMVYHFDGDKVFITGYGYNSEILSEATVSSTMTYDENGWCTKFVVQSSASLDAMVYIRITCLGIDETSIITVNEPIY